MKGNNKKKMGAVVCPLLASPFGEADERSEAGEGPLSPPVADSSPIGRAKQRIAILNPPIFSPKFP